MNGITLDYMEEYLRSLIPHSEDIFKELEEYAHNNNVPIAQKETAQFLRTMVTIKNPKKILELGTAIGYSAMVMCHSLNNKVKITTVERDLSMIEIAKENIKKLNYEDNINIIQGDALEVINELEDKYDLIFLDAGKGHYNHILPRILDLLSQDGIIIADNVLFRGMVANNDLVIRRKITIVKRMRSYLKMINEDEGLVTSVIPMGDGIAVTTRRKKNE